MSDKSHTGFRQCFYDFTFYLPRDSDALEGAVNGFCAIEGAGAAFLEKVCWLGGLGGDEVGVGGEGVVG